MTTKTKTETVTTDVKRKKKGRIQHKIYFESEATATPSKTVKKQLKTLVKESPSLFANSDGTLATALSDDNVERKRRFLQQVNNYTNRRKASYFAKKTVPRYGTMRNFMAANFTSFFTKYEKMFRSRKIFYISRETVPAKKLKIEGPLSINISNNAVSALIDCTNNFIATILAPTAVFLQNRGNVIAKPHHMISALEIFIQNNKYNPMAIYIREIIDNYHTMFKSSSYSEFMSTLQFDGIEFPLVSLYGISSEAVKIISAKCGILMQSPWNKRFVNIIANFFVLRLSRDCLLMARALKKKTISLEMVEYNLKTFQMRRC